MAKTLRFNFHIPPETLIDKANKAASKSGKVTFSGDQVSGSVQSPKWQATYQIHSTSTQPEQHSIELVVTKKPALLPWALLEGQLRKFFEQLSEETLAQWEQDNEKHSD